MRTWNSALCYGRLAKVSWPYLSMRRWHLLAEQGQDKPNWGRNWKRRAKYQSHILMDSSKSHPRGGYLWKVSHILSESNIGPCRINQISETLRVFCRFVLPCQILLPPIKTVGSTIRQRKILPVKLCFINMYTYHNPKPTLTVMHIQ